MPDSFLANWRKKKKGKKGKKKFSRCLGILQDIRHGFIFSLWLNESSAYASPIKCRRFRGFRAPQRPNLVDSVGRAFPQTLRPPCVALSFFSFFFPSPPPHPHLKSREVIARIINPDLRIKIGENCSRDFHNYSSNRNSLPHVLTHLLPCFIKRERKEQNKKLSRRKIRLTSVSKYSKYHPGAGRLFALGELSWFTLRRKRCRAIPRKSLMYS